MRVMGHWAVLLAVASAGAATLPVRFDQTGDGAFVCEGRGYRARLGRGEIALEWGETRSRMRLVGARGAGPEGLERAPGAGNYFLGGERLTNLAGFLRVRYREIYPGIDLVFYGAGGALEYDFLVAPGADPGRIRLAISGAGWKLNAEGGLEVGPLVWRRPDVFQGADRIEARYRVRGAEVGFALGAWDRTRPLTIDPVLAYSTYLGGTNNEAARAIGLDGAGNVYLAGYTTSGNLPVSRTAAQSAYGGGTTNFMTGDAFVAKFNPSGVLVYLTYLGGSGDDVASAIAVDAAGNAYVTGYTNSRNFPVSANAAQPGYAGAGGNDLGKFGDAFVAKLSPNGDQILYATYFGGQMDEVGLGIAIDASGAAYITGTTVSFNLPTTQGVYQPRFRGSGGQPVTDFGGVPFFVAGDGFVAKLNPAGSAVVWATYLGGLQDDTPMAIALDKSGNVIVAGNTLSTDYPTTPGALQRQHRGSDPENMFFHLGDGFITKLTPDGSALVWSTLLGASGDDSITAMALDATGAVYVTGTTSSTNFPVTAGAWRTKYGGPLTQFSERIVGDAYLAKLDPAGGSLVFATYINGSGDDGGYGVALGADGMIWVTGQTVSTDFPVTSDAAQKVLVGKGGENINFDDWGDGFLVGITADGSKATYVTFMGGSRDDSAQGVAVDAAGNVWVTGCTMSGNFPVTTGAQQAAFGGFSFVGRLKGDAFLAKFGAPAPPPPPPPTLTVTAVTNAASNAAGAVSPGMIFVAYGNGLGPAALAGASLDASGKLASTIAGAQILFDGIAAPLVYASATQVSGIVPYEVAGKSTTQVTARYQGSTTTALAVNVASAVPALFSADFSGKGQGAILNQDGTYNSSANPAAPGSVIVLFGTGEGQTSPAGVDGLIAAGLPPKPTQTVTVTIAGKPVDVAYQGGAPQEVAGLYQLNVTVPVGTPSGNQPVVLTVGGISSLTGFTVAVK
jgi:uncharacterized protein (TIGR03437 family)